MESNKQANNDQDGKDENKPERPTYEMFGFTFKDYTAEEIAEYYRQEEIRRKENRRKMLILFGKFLYHAFWAYWVYAAYCIAYIQT